MTELPDLPSNVHDLIKIPEHKKRLDEFIKEASRSQYIKGCLSKCRPDLRIQPFMQSEDEDLIYVGVDHESELACQIDWLGGDFCNERINFSVQPGGSLLRVIELIPPIDPHKIDSHYVNANLGVDKAIEFVEYVMGEPAEDLEGILPFLEVDNREQLEIALLHREFRRKHFDFVAQVAIEHSELSTDTLD